MKGLRFRRFWVLGKCCPGFMPRVLRALEVLQGYGIRLQGRGRRASCLGLRDYVSGI